MVMRGQKKEVPPLESKVEADFLKELRKIPVPLKIRKMNGMGYRDWADRMILGPRGFIVFVELKRPRLGKLSPGQSAMIADLTELGHKMVVFDDAKLAAEWVRHELRAHGVMP
jgi:hypothetical protein